MSTELAPVAVSEHRPGDVIAGRYVLTRKLGEGGMGFVWVARSRALDVDVALKMLRPEIAGAEGVERMAREARTAAQLGHPAMVRVLDFGSTERGAPFLAMELLQGEELQTMLLRAGRLPAERAAALLLPIIDGLGTAHEKGIVHRDIKPANIFIASDGQGRIQPKVLDFGIAKLDHSHVSTRLTQVGAVLGSPQYLSPEQAEGLDDVDPRSDIWSLGVVLYELTTGTPPFEASNYNALIRKILRDAPTPTTEHAAGDAQFWTIVERCLKKDPAERWASMWELGEALALWLFERGVRVDAASRSLKHDWLESGVTGLQILVTSEAPDAHTLPAGAAVELVAAAKVSPSPTSGRNAPTLIKRRRRSWLPALVGFAVVAAAALLVFTLLWSRSPAPAAAEVRRQAVVSPHVVVSPPPVIEAPSVTAQAPSALPIEAVPSAARAATASSTAKARPPTRAPGSSPSATRVTTPQKAPQRKGLNTEFGF
jgi:eukaryotic-like serine/threonine-protein kinase